ncbi:MAG: hypothetical protein WA797_07880 [Acidimicrobiales bacterium]
MHREPGVVPAGEVSAGEVSAGQVSAGQVSAGHGRPAPDRAGGGCGCRIKGLGL